MYITRPQEGWGKARGGRVARGGCRDINGGEERSERVVPPHPERICPIMLPRGTLETINPH